MTNAVLGESFSGLHASYLGVDIPVEETRGLTMTITVSRRVSTFLTVLGLAVLSLSATASAAPTIRSFKVKAVPVPGYPGTGDILGAGAVIQGEAAIAGTEYGGFPPPLIGITFYAPAGAKLHPQGFATCTPSVLEDSGPGSCPKRSIAGPKGFAAGVVSFGGERVPETASVQPFFAPDGKLEDFVDGTTPTLIEILAPAHIVNSSPPSDVEFVGEIPLIETVPRALDASFLEGTVSLGAAYKQGKKTVSYITMPTRCPKGGGFPVRADLSFLGGATVEASYKMPCPKK